MLKLVEIEHQHSDRSAANRGGRGGGGDRADGGSCRGVGGG